MYIRLASQFVKDKNNFIILDHIKIKLDAYNILLLTLTKWRQGREITESQTSESNPPAQIISIRIK